MAKHTSIKVTAHQGKEWLGDSTLNRPVKHAAHLAGRTRDAADTYLKLKSLEIPTGDCELTFDGHTDEGQKLDLKPIKTNRTGVQVAHLITNHADLEAEAFDAFEASK